MNRENNFEKHSCALCPNLSNAILTYLIIFSIILFSSGCATKEYVPVIEKVTVIPCPRPEQVYELIPLKDNYLDSKVNATVLEKNQIITFEYIKDLQNTIICYERQI